MDNTEGFDDFFGQAKQGGDGFSYKMHQLSEKEPNIFRISPPVKSLKGVGRWSVYDSLHYGYTIPNEQNPDKPRHKPFRCIAKKDRGTGMITQDCPECQYLESKEKELKALEAREIASGRSPEEAKEATKGAARLLREHNLDKKHYVLAKNLAGEWGPLKIPHRAKQALDNLIEKYAKENEGQSPLAASGGVWFQFTRKGKGLQTEHYVEIASESLGGGRFQHKNGALTQIDVEGITKCPDLATLNDNKNLTYDQIIALVRSGGDPTVCAQVFGQGSRKQNPVQQAMPQQQIPASMPVVQQVAPAIPVPVDDEEARLEAQLAAARARKASAQAAPVQGAPVAPTLAPQAPMTPTVSGPAAATFSELMKLDPREFLQKFPDPNKK